MRTYKKMLFKVPNPMKKKRSLLQQEIFLQYAQWMYDIKDIISPVDMPELTDEQWKTICHNFAFNLNDYLKNLRDKLFKF